MSLLYIHEYSVHFIPAGALGKMKYACVEEEPKCARLNSGNKKYFVFTAVNVELYIFYFIQTELLRPWRFRCLCVCSVLCGLIWWKIMQDACVLCRYYKFFLYKIWMNKWRGKSRHWKIMWHLNYMDYGALEWGNPRWARKRVVCTTEYVKRALKIEINYLPSRRLS